MKRRGEKSGTAKQNKTRQQGKSTDGDENEEDDDDERRNSVLGAPSANTGSTRHSSLAENVMKKWKSESAPWPERERERELSD